MSWAWSSLPSSSTTASTTAAVPELEAAYGDKLRPMDAFKDSAPAELDQTAWATMT